MERISVTRDYKLLKLRLVLKGFFMRHKDAFSFFKVLLSNPRSVGAIVPSSKELAKEMANHVMLAPKKLIVELGAGTGVVTEALLRAGVDPKQIVVVEYAAELVKKLRQRFPKVQIIQGDAANLLHLLGEKSHQVGTIVSSLPLRSLPKATSRSVLRHIEHLLPHGGRYIQYTYSYGKNHFGNLDKFKIIHSKRIWRNIPPARVDVFEAGHQS